MASFGRCFCTSRATATAFAVRPASSFEHDDAALRFDEIRLERQRLAQRLQRGVVVLGRHLGFGHAKQRNRRIRLQLDELVVARERLIRVARGELSAAPAPTGSPGRSGNAASASCAAATAFLASLVRSQCAISVSRGSTACRIGRDGLVDQRRDFVGRSAPLRAQFGEREQRPHVLRVLGQHRVEALLRVVRLLVGQIQARETSPPPGSTPGRAPSARSNCLRAPAMSPLPSRTTPRRLRGSGLFGCFFSSASMAASALSNSRACKRRPDQDQVGLRPRALGRCALRAPETPCPSRPSPGG